MASGQYVKRAIRRGGQPVGPAMQIALAAMGNTQTREQRWQLDLCDCVGVIVDGGVISTAWNNAFAAESVLLILA